MSCLQILGSALKGKFAQAYLYQSEGILKGLEGWWRWWWNPRRLKMALYVEIHLTRCRFTIQSSSIERSSYHVFNIESIVESAIPPDSSLEDLGSS